MIRKQENQEEIVLSEIRKECLAQTNYIVSNPSNKTLLIMLISHHKRVFIVI
jgi:hypothetical protein